jgi:hypothetical protein
MHLALVLEHTLDPPTRMSFESCTMHCKGTVTSIQSWGTSLSGLDGIEMGEVLPEEDAEDELPAVEL